VKFARVDGIMNLERIRLQAARFRALAASERERAATEPDASWRRLHEAGAANYEQCAADLEKLADSNDPVVEAPERKARRTKPAAR
jgi:hypothetical protein